eukprot:TRINITY_DN12244_c0_g2_i1.p1 TRINITY_DN12244_c0_g2~~TRINITY_DN12244_c0_g2_i1.p1  ORF type:complete len:197 (-),score=1.83 TRINITY_DN12244_c0_g2_i1:15-566(-)
MCIRDRSTWASLQDKNYVSRNFVQQQGQFYQIKEGHAQQPNDVQQLWDRKNLEKLQSYSQCTIFRQIAQCNANLTAFYQKNAISQYKPNQYLPSDEQYLLQGIVYYSHQDERHYYLKRFQKDPFIVRKPITTYVLEAFCHKSIFLKKSLVMNIMNYSYICTGFYSKQKSNQSQKNRINVFKQT